MKNKRLLKLFIPILLMLVLVVGLPLMSGCGPETAPPAVGLKPIKIGAPLPMTGWAAADGQGYFQGLTFAIDEINAEGGLLGRPLEILLYDTKDFAPETLRLASDQLVAGDKVDMATGGWSGWGGDVSAFGKYSIPYFMYDASETALQVMAEPGNENVFMGSDNESSNGMAYWEAVVNIPYEFPNNKLALIGTDDAWGAGVVEGIKDIAETTGWEIPIHETVPYGTVEWKTILAKVRKEEPAALHIEVASPPDVIAFFHQFMEQPTNTILSYGYSMSSPDFMSAMGAEADGIMGATGGYIAFPPSTPEIADWFDRFEFKFGNKPSAGAPWMYNSFMMWAEAVQQVGDPTEYDAIVEWLENNTFQSMPGMRTLDFDERHCTPMSQHHAVSAQIQGGQYYTLSHHVFGDPYVDYQGNSCSFQIPPWITTE